jgi:GntR family transcriptional repressor for pyruvate dehydrogenase complex
MTSIADYSEGALVTRERLAALLEGRVVSGEFGEGEKLPSERVLAERFGVSRPVVREALRGLAERGLVEVVPGRGAYVRRFRMADAARPLDMLFRRRRPTPRDLVEARRMLECEAACLAATRADEEDLKAMEAALVRFERAGDLLEKVAQDVAFHASIARAAHNPVVETMFASVVNLVAEVMLRSLGDPDVSRAGLPYHREIFEAVRGRDPEKARVAMGEHLLVAERTYGDDYDRPLEDLTGRRLGYRLDTDAILESLSGSPED